MKQIERNTLRIEQNKQAIQKGKRERRYLLIGLLIMVVYNSYLTYKQHTLETCQANLYTHLTGQKAPTVKQLDAVPNPEEYKSLFEGCDK